MRNRGKEGMGCSAVHLGLTDWQGNTKMKNMITPIYFEVRMKQANKLILLLMALLPTLLAAWPSYQSMSTPGFEVFYRPGWETEALNVLQAMEYSRPYVEKLTGNKLPKIPYVIEDTGNMVNGYASPVGSKIAVFAYPPSGSELSFGEDWWQLVGMHEYIHMAQMTKVSGEPALLRAIFGNFLYPNLYQPMWMTEGITVYGESNISPYSGRLKGATYPAIINTLAREGKLPSPSKAGYMSYDTPLAHYYVFGGSFYQYLADTYGQDRFAALFEYTGSTLASYLNPLTTYLSIDKAYETAYGKPLTALWLEWQAKETSKPFTLPEENLSRDGWRASDLKYHDGMLYYISYKLDKTGPSSGFSSYRLMRMSDLNGTPRRDVLLEQDAEFPAGFHIQNGRIYYSRLEFQGGYDNNEYDGLGAVSELWSMNLDGSGNTKLTKGQFRAFCPLPDGKLLIAADDATHRASIIQQFDPSSRTLEELIRLDHLVSGIFSQNGKFYVTARGFWSNNGIFELNLKSGQLMPIIDTPSMESIVSVNGNDMVFEAVYNNQNGCYLRKLDSGQTFRFSGVSEVTSLAMSPAGDTWFISMSSKGQDVYADRLKLQSYQIPSLPRSDPPYRRLEYGKDDMVLDTYPVQYGGYGKNITHALWPRLYRFPYIEGRQDSLVVGVMMAGMDILGDFPMWNATVLYDSFREEWGVDLGIENSFFRPLKHQLQFQLDFDGERQLNSVQYLSLLTRMNYGIQNAWTGFGFQLGDRETRKLWYPFVGMNFAWAGGGLQTNNSLMYETTDFFASDRDRLGWHGRAVLRQKMPVGSELRARIQAGWDPDANVDEVFQPIRGWDDDWTARKGIILSASWYKPILKIREALWTPNIYFGDLSVGMFYDRAIPWDEPAAETRSSMGAELVLELNAAYMFAMDLGLRVSFPEGGDSRLDVMLGTDF